MNTQRMPRLHVGLGWNAPGLTLFPVWAEMPVSGIQVVRPDDVLVTERSEGPSVAQLVVSNTGTDPVLLLEGEVLEGGWQNRVLNVDLLLAGGQSHVVDVTCVEQGRWHGNREHARRGRLAPGGIRMGLRTPAGSRQQAVWRRVATFEPTLGRTATESLTDHLDRVAAGADAHGRAVGRARRSEIPTQPLPGQVGVIGALGGWPAWLEILPSPDALADFWQALVDAALLDAHAAPQRVCPAQLARDFAVACRGLRLADHAPAGAGRAVAATSGRLTMRGISSPEGDLLHALVMDAGNRTWGDAQ